jgi:hypothetical protein
MLMVTFQLSLSVSRYTTADRLEPPRETTMQNMTAIGFTIFASLLIVAVVILALAMVTSLTIVGALMILAVVDAVILIGGYLIIRRAASSAE